MSDKSPESESLPLDAAVFWSAGADVTLRKTPTDQPLPLRRLGPSPFTGSSFPVLGLLETVYDHVMERTRARWQHTNGNGKTHDAATEPPASASDL